MSEQQGVLKKIISFFSFEADSDEMEELGVEKERHIDNKKVIPINKRARHAEISIYSPNSYEDALVLADCLKEGKAIVLNLSRLDLALATRILDFVSGIIHAIEGSFKKVGDNIFVFTPSSIEITSDSDLRGPAKEKEGLFFGER